MPWHISVPDIVPAITAPDAASDVAVTPIDEDLQERLAEGEPKYLIVDRSESQTNKAGGNL